MKKYFFIAMIALGILPAVAQSDKEFSVDVQLRPRAELRNGQGSLMADGSQTAAFISNRARLGLNYKSSWVDMRVAGQHVGTWGADAQTAKTGNFMLNEAWAKIHTKGGKFYMQVGRQALFYDDQRLLGGLDWAQTGRWHDALKLGMNLKEDKLDVILSFNQTDENKNGTYYAAGDTKNDAQYKSMEAAWYHHQFTKAHFGVSLLFMNVGWETGTAAKAATEKEPAVMASGKTAFMQTFGTYLSYTPSWGAINGSFYYQTGKNSTDRKVGAYTWNLEAKEKAASVVTVTEGVDFRSGDDDPNVGTRHCFDQLWGTHHKFYGTMDYFMQNVTCGLWDPHVGASFKVIKPLSIDLTYHYFLSDKLIHIASADVQNEDGTVTQTWKRNLGSEIDLQVNWKLVKDVTLQAGFSTMIAADALKAQQKVTNAKGFQSWGWLSLNVNPTVFTTMFFHRK